jgi:hypothetical protein
VQIAVVLVGVVIWFRRRGRRAGAQAATEACCPACLVLGLAAPRLFSLEPLEPAP